MRRKMAAAGPDERVPREYPPQPPPGEYQHAHPPPLPMDYPYPPPGYPSPPPHAGSPWSPQWGPASAGPTPAPPPFSPHYPPRPATASGAFPNGPHGGYPERPPSSHGHGPLPMHSPDLRMRNGRDRLPPPHPMDVKPNLPSLPAVLSGRPGGPPPLPPPPPHSQRRLSGMTSPSNSASSYWN